MAEKQISEGEQTNLRPAVIAILLLILAAAFRFPYSFYTLLRLPALDNQNTCLTHRCRDYAIFECA